VRQTQQTGRDAGISLGGHLGVERAPARSGVDFGLSTFLAVTDSRGLTTFRRKIDVFGSTVNGFGRAKTAGLPAVIFEGLW
jgi:hypothetical protein